MRPPGRIGSDRPPKAKRQAPPAPLRDRLAVLLAVVTVACVGAAFFFATDMKFLMPGPLASSHAAIENCNACHTKSGSGKFMPAIEHRDRGRCHHQRHHPVPDHRRQNCRDKGRLRRDFDQRSTAPRQVRRRRLRQVDKVQQHRRRQTKPDDHRIAAGEQHRREQVARPDRGFRAEHSRDDATRQHQRDRLRTKRLVGNLGGCVAPILRTSVNQITASDTGTMGVYALGVLPFLAAAMMFATRRFKNKADELLEQ